ncbi:MAG: hypothetical protein WCC58_03895 [Burkholderiales bacterium]
MRFQIIQCMGIEVLHLDFQYSDGNAWPADHWKASVGSAKPSVPTLKA